MHSYKPSRCVRLLLQLLPEDGNLTGLRLVTRNPLTVTSHDRSGISSERESRPLVVTTKTESSPGPT